MSFTVIDPRDVRDLAPDVLSSNGIPRVMPAAYYKKTSLYERAVFGNRQGLYGFPTTELVDWLRVAIGGRTAIEIGAGHGVLAEALCIPATDSKLQDDPEIAALYSGMGQSVVTYGNNVEKLEAEQAVTMYRPDVVIASWVTHMYLESRHGAGGNMFGVMEENIISACQSYIFIGNRKVHAQKSIWALPHRIIEPDWLFSRASNGSPDFIAVWGA